MNLQLDRKKFYSTYIAGLLARLKPPKNFFYITLNLLKLLSLNTVFLMHNPMGQNQNIHNYVAMATSFVKFFGNSEMIIISQELSSFKSIPPIELQLIIC